jgi:hypothetical protein
MTLEQRRSLRIGEIGLVGHGCTANNMKLWGNPIVLVYSSHSLRKQPEALQAQPFVTIRIVT